MIERIDLPDRLPSDPELTLWRAWMRRHGIDPSDVPLGEWIERDGRVLRYVAVVRDAGGRPVFDRERDSFAVEVRECQVYGRRPDPFPVPG